MESLSLDQASRNPSKPLGHILLNHAFNFFSGDNIPGKPNFCRGLARVQGWGNDTDTMPMGQERTATVAIIQGVRSGRQAERLSAIGSQEMPLRSQDEEAPSRFSERIARVSDSG